METIVFHIYLVLIWLFLTSSYLVYKEITRAVDESIEKKKMLSSIEAMLKEELKATDLEAKRLALWTADRIKRDNEKKK